MTDFHSNPDMLLHKIQKEEEDKYKGHLYIFFGYAAGVGKTYAMLQAAHDALQNGVDVIVGYVEPHMRPDTSSLLNGLEILPTKKYEHGSICVNEFDLDAALARKPGLILVDELAHTNANGCRHAKRYQDVCELLAAGIDVYTTVNVQHIESLNDMVASITGIYVQERIPDKIFDQANQVKLVDIEPLELTARLQEGKIYKNEQANKALKNFFTVENLTALREIALRHCADRINAKSESERSKGNTDYHIEEHILVCLSSSPSNSKIIRTAARMAHAFSGSFTALFVETPSFEKMSADDKNRLRENTHLAEQLGANIETVYGDDIALQIAEFSRISGVSKIVLGRNNAKKRSIFSQPPLVEKLTAYIPGTDIYIIPDSTAFTYTPKKQPAPFSITLNPYDVAKSAAFLTAATLLGFLFRSFGLGEANIIMGYILGVLITAITTSRRYYSLVSSLLSVLAFNFFFTEPHYTLKAYDSSYPVTFLIMFLSAFITASLALRLKQTALVSAEAAGRTKILLETNQSLQQADNTDDIIETTASQITKLLQRGIVFYPYTKEHLLSPKTYSVNGEAFPASCISQNEMAVASWVAKNNKRAGATTSTLSNAKCLYLAVRIGQTVYGVMGIVINKEPLNPSEYSILLSILGECAVAMDRVQAYLEKEEAAVLAKNEQLRANLLRSISHDLRTPLTAIAGNAGNLLANEATFDWNTRRGIYNDIYENSLWLMNLVENLLSISRINNGKMNLNLSSELIDDVITEALHHINSVQDSHHIIRKESEDMIIAKIDARLIIQVIINLIDNALKYTPAGSTITISTKVMKPLVLISVSDDGPGISEEIKPHIFDMFYTGSNKLGDSRRSMGLGLALCKSIVTAHNGEISVYDTYPHGSTFTFSLIMEEVTIHE